MLQRIGNSWSKNSVRILIVRDVGMQSSRTEFIGVDSDGPSNGRILTSQDFLASAGFAIVFCRHELLPPRVASINMPVFRAQAG